MQFGNFAHKKTSNDGQNKLTIGDQFKQVPLTSIDLRTDTEKVT